MQLLVVILSSLLLCSGVLGAAYTDCGSTKGKVSGVRVSGCENQSICHLKRGTTATISVMFQSLTDSNSAEAVVHGIISGVPLPFPPPQPDGCVNCGLSCPLSNAHNYNYTSTIDVKDSYPPVSVGVKWELLDDDKEDLFCVLIPSKIV